MVEDKAEEGMTAEETTAEETVADEKMSTAEDSAADELREGMVDQKSVLMCSFLHCASPIGVVEHSSTQFYTQLKGLYEL